MKRGLKQKKSTGRQTLVSKVSYVKRNWQLYVFFLMPALVLTIIFIPNMLFCFFSGEVSGGIIFLLFVCGIDIPGYFGIRSLKKKYKQALLREKQEKEKENQNEKDN